MAPGLTQPTHAVKEPSPPAHPPELDELTLRRAQRGDRDACRQLVITYQRAVFALVSRMLPADQHDHVEDIAQETFLQVFRALQKFSLLGPAKLSTWILTIASRRAIDWLRKARPATQPLDDRAIAQDSTATPTGQIHQAIGEALAALPYEYRAAFLLREYHGLNYQEIAQALAIEIGTVKSRLSRARAAIRQRLVEDLS